MIARQFVDETRRYLVLPLVVDPAVGGGKPSPSLVVATSAKR
jgi:hypothetical protein